MVINLLGNFENINKKVFLGGNIYDILRCLKFIPMKKANCSWLTSFRFVLSHTKIISKFKTEVSHTYFFLINNIQIIQM